MWYIYSIYVLLLCFVVFLSIRLANLVDLLDKKTSISGAFIGGVLLAAITSLPELFTAISAVAIVNSPELVVGDILGSNIFNLVVLAVLTLLFFKNFRNSHVDRWHFISLCVLLLMYGITVYAIFAPETMQPMMGSINFLSLVILVIYILLLWKQPKVSEEDDKEADSNLTIKPKLLMRRY